MTTGCLGSPFNFANYKTPNYKLLGTRNSVLGTDLLRHVRRHAMRHGRGLLPLRILLLLLLLLLQPLQLLQ